MQPQQQPQMTQEEAAEQDFRNNLRDVNLIIRKLAPLCKTIHDMVGLIDLALTNDAQLAILIREVSPIQLRK